MIKSALVLAYCFLLLAADGQETQQHAAEEDPRSELESSEDEHDEAPKTIVTLKNGLDFNLDIVRVIDFDYEEEEDGWHEWEEVFGNVEPGEEVELLDPEEGDQYLVLESGGDDDYLKLIHIEELKNETITIDESNLDELDEEEDFDEDMGEL